MTPTPQNSSKKSVQFPVQEQGLLLETLLLHRDLNSHNTWKRLLSSGRIYVDGKLIKQHDYVVKVGQIIEVSSEPLPPRKPIPLQQKRIKILYEDEWYVAIDKPAGLLSIATEKEKDRTAYHMLRAQLQTTAPYLKLFVVHRLDRETSGVLLFAKSDEAKRAMQEDWSTQVQRRVYLAVVQGKITEEQGQWEHALKENREGEVYVVKPEEEEAKIAITHFSTIRTNDQYSLLELTLDTGRKHQIRVQASMSGHPVIGDRKYGGHEDPLHRMGLHASELTFSHPYLHQIVTVKTDIPTAFRSLFGTAVNKGGTR